MDHLCPQPRFFSYWPHCLLPLVALLGLFLPAVLGGATLDKYEGQTVQAIHFDSSEAFNTSQFTGLLALKTGQPLSQPALHQSIQALYDTRLLSAIAVDAESTEGGVIVTFRLRPNYFFSDFHLRGDPVFKSSLSSFMQLPLGEPFAAGVVEDMLAKIKKAVEAAGYYEAVVKSETHFLSQGKLVAVDFNVQAGPKAPLSAIRISGTPRWSDKLIFSNMKLKPGKPFDADLLQRDFVRLRKLYSDRGFLNSTFRVEKTSYSPQQAAVTLDLLINSGPFIYVQLSGARISQKKLRGLIPVYEEGSIDLDLIAEGKRNLTQYFSERGYFDAVVEPELISVPEEQAYQINFKIEHGKKQEVTAVQIQGARHFDPNTLLDSLQTSKSGWIPRLHRGKFSQDLLVADAETLRQLYLKEGFEQASVKSSYQRDSSGNNVGVTFTIEEGVQTTVSDVAFEGNLKIPTSQLQNELQLKPDHFFSQSLLDEDQRNILSEYDTLGFNDAKVSSQLQRDEAHHIRILYRITEGDPLRVGDVLVTGNLSTKRKIITRSLLFREGDPFSQSRILGSEQRLYGMGLFNRASILPLNVNQPTPFKPVLVRVEEASPLILGYGVGYVDKQDYRGLEGIRGTFDISHNNLFGLARTISFRASASYQEQRGQITYREPRLFNWDLDSSIFLFIEQSRRPSFVTLRNNASVQVMKHLSNKNNFIFRYTYETVDLSDKNVNPEATGQENLGTIGLSSFSTAWYRDTRNDLFDPKRGFYNSLSFLVTAEPIGSEANYFQFYAQSSGTRELGAGIVLAGSFRLGLTKPWGYYSDGNPMEVPISERFFAGGANTLRGFEMDMAGPLDPVTNNPIGGNAVVIINLEFRLPLSKHLSVAPFYDTGNVFPKISDMRLSSFTNTVGLSFRYKTPFGPLRLDFGYNLKPLPGQKNPLPNFTIGNPF
jgi:outer membrane protein insertion porin family